MKYLATINICTLSVCSEFRDFHIRCTGEQIVLRIDILKNISEILSGRTQTECYSIASMEDEFINSSHNFVLGRGNTGPYLRASLSSAQWQQEKHMMTTVKVCEKVRGAAVVNLKNELRKLRKACQGDLLGCLEKTKVSKIIFSPPQSS